MANDYISQITLPDNQTFDLKDAGAARDSHSHGNISNAGTIATSTSSTIAKNDSLVISTTANSGKLTRSSITFDGSTTSNVLSQKGTWVAMYTHPTTEGNKHIPSGGSSGKFLGWDSAGTAKWVDNPNTDTHMNVSLAGTAITHHFILMTSVTPTNTATQHTGLGATSLWVNSADKSKFELVLGNSTTITTSGGQYGQLALYNEYNAGTYLRSANGSGWKTATLPAITGILAILTSGTAKGSNTKPVKVANTGEIQECSDYAGGTKVTLNGTDMGATTATIFAATTTGTAGQVLKSQGSGEPEWANEYSIEILQL